MHVVLTSDQSRYIAERIRRFVAEAPPGYQALAADVADLKVLPLLLGWTEITAIREDGQLVKFSTEGEYEGAVPVEDLVLARASLKAAADQHPGLEALRPLRGPESRDCDLCHGDGVLPGKPMLVCKCGGVGFLD